MAKTPDGRFFKKPRRWQHWNYGQKGAYFITINTLNRRRFFGFIKGGKVHLSEIGKIARDEWLKTKEIRPDLKLYMNDFIIMPNHIHGIIIIRRNISLQCSSNKPDIITYSTKYGPQKHNIPSIIRGFKGKVTFRAKKINQKFAWQPRYYDHVIRNYTEYEKIRIYILENPLHPC